MNDPREHRQADRAWGLCASCGQARVVTSDRGARFVRCERAATDPAFPRYPTLPMLACHGYEGPGTTDANLL